MQGLLEEFCLQSKVVQKPNTRIYAKGNPKATSKPKYAHTAGLMERLLKKIQQWLSVRRKTAHLRKTLNKRNF